MSLEYKILLLTARESLLSSELRSPPQADLAISYYYLWGDEA